MYAAKTVYFLPFYDSDGTIAKLDEKYKTACVLSYFKEEKKTTCFFILYTDLNHSYHKMDSVDCANQLIDSKPFWSPSGFKCVNDDGQIFYFIVEWIYVAYQILNHGKKESSLLSLNKMSSG